MKIMQRFIPTSNKDTRPGIKMVPKYITIHETDNPSPGADAQAHARLQERGNDRTASWHLQIDDQETIQSIPFDEAAWAAGDGRNGTGNLKSIHIEICVNSDGDYKQAVQNTAEVTKQLLDQLNIPQSNVVQHNFWTGKNCPRNLRSGEKGISWSEFINMVNSNEVQLDPPQLVEEVFVHSSTIIQRVRALVKTDIRKAPTHQSEFIRDTFPGEEFNVFAREGDWHNIGGANWIDGNGGRNLFWIDNPSLRYPATETSKTDIPYPGRLNRIGSRGKDVELIQKALGVEVDSIFGSKTEAAVKSFQKRRGLIVDGIVGVKTWSAMF